LAIYLYAIAPAPLEVEGLQGITGEALGCLPVGELVAVTSSVETAPAASVERLTAQDALIRALALRTDALLPARFGTTERSPAALISRLELMEAPLAKALSEVRGCEQMTLRLFTEDGRSPREPVDEGPGAGTRYLLRARERISPPLPELKGLRAKLGKQLRGERVKGAQTPPLRASVFHLIPRGTSARYLELAESTRRPKGVRWVASGPFPPYAFAPEALS
jgi:hypothetical protein